MLARRVRASVAVPIGDPRGSPFGVLEVHYTQPETVPADCGPFLRALANVLAEAIHSRDANETIRVQALHDGLTGCRTGRCFTTASHTRWLGMIDGASASLCS